MALATSKPGFRQPTFHKAGYANFLNLTSSRVLNHALNTPLSTLNLAVDLLDESLEKNRNKRYLHQLKLALKQLRGLLDYVKGKEIIKIQQFDILHATQEVAILYRQQGVYITITPAHSKNKYRITGPKILYQEAISCLISNAIQAYPVCATGIPIILACRQNKWSVRVDVIDLGKGMTKWQQFYALAHGLKLNNQEKGLGLPFAKNIIEDNFRGRFWLRSTIDSGTRVSIVIPKEIKRSTKQT